MMLCSIAPARAASLASIAVLSLKIPDDYDNELIA
jgi:hypothetical protein